MGLYSIKCEVLRVMSQSYEDFFHCRHLFKLKVPCNGTFLLKIYNEAFDTWEYPMSFARQGFRPVYKKGYGTGAKNYI